LILIEERSAERKPYEASSILVARFYYFRSALVLSCVFMAMECCGEEEPEGVELDGMEITVERFVIQRCCYIVGVRCS
jgi:hypothetical protein